MAAIAFVLLGCTKNEFTIDLSLEGASTSDYQVDYYASDKKQGFYVHTNMIVTQGAGSLRGSTRYPTLVYVTGRRQLLPLVLYAERGDKIRLTGSGGDPLAWEAGGNRLNEEWSAWRQANLGVLTGGVADSINAAVARQIDADASSELSLMLLLTTFDRAADEAMYDSLWYKLPLGLRDGGLARLAARADQTGAGVRRPARLSSLVLRGWGGLDTLRTGDVEATLLCFRAGSRSMGTALYNDTLASLARRYPKKKTRHIADISADPDSVSWLAPLRSDTLKGVKRAWMPLGGADATAMALGVRALPCYLVYGRDGVLRYRGGDLAEAVAAFDALLGGSKK